MENSQNRYLDAHTTLPSEALEWIVKQTHVRTNYPQMLSGRLVGEFLKILVEATGAARVLEIGTFTGYSAVCLASGLPDGGHLDALEINDELEEIIHEGWRRAGLDDLITLHIGDASEFMRSAEPGTYDLIYIDANKREYPDYLRIVMGDDGGSPLVHKGTWILADNVLWDGKVCEEHPKGDAQTQGIIAFNDAVKADDRLENFILPLRDGVNIIRVK